MCVGERERERERERDLVIKSNEGVIFVNKNPTYLKDSYLWSLYKEVVITLKNFNMKLVVLLIFMSTSTLWD
jgi:hypothetical protein